MSDLGIDQIARHGEQFDPAARAGQPEREIEIMDHLVVELPARHGDIGGRRRRGIAAHDADDLDFPHLPDIHRGLDRAVGRIEATLKSDHDRHVDAADRLRAGLDALHVEIDRLFAQDGLSGLCRGNDQIDMGVRRRSDNDRVY